MMQANSNVLRLFTVRVAGGLNIYLSVSILFFGNKAKATRALSMPLTRLRCCAVQQLVQRSLLAARSAALFLLHSPCAHADRASDAARREPSARHQIFHLPVSLSLSSGRGTMAEVGIGGV